MAAGARSPTSSHRAEVERGASITVEGTVTRVTYFREEIGYLVARVRPSGGGEELVAVGRLPRLEAGETVRLVGAWTTHPVHGRRFAATDCQAVLPATVDGMRAYLGSGLIAGVGPRLAERIVERFGLETFDVIERAPERLAEVRGLGAERRRAIAAAWAEQRAVKDVMVALAELEVPAGLAARIYRRYGDTAGDVVRERPYDLARDVEGIGFRTADAVARRLGRPLDAPDRLAAGLAYVLWEATTEGHVFLPEDELLRRGARLLRASSAALRDALDAARRGGGGLVTDDVDGARAVYLAPFFGAELAVARRLAALAGGSADRLAAFRNVDFRRAFAYLRERAGVELSSAQQDAIVAALTSPVAVLTGGPGTGKTTALRGLVAMLEAKGRSYLLAAPTGKAARRLADATGRPAATLHRLLGLRMGEAAGGLERPLSADMVIVDEASMLDLQLANVLVRALPAGCHLLLVGDSDQLPPVGAGDVLRGMIASGIAPVSRLQAVFRQAERSGIVRNAHLINRGEAPLLRGLDDWFFLSEDDPERLAELVVDVATRRLPARYGLDAVQVLTPMHRGPLGVAALNERLQAALNPPRPDRPERQLGGRVLRVGDRVLATRNDYRLEVFNGDAGTLARVDLAGGGVDVTLEDGRTVRFDSGDLDALLHGYALSVHRAQGSEFPAVVLPLHPIHGSMLRRDLLYTAVTRARCLVVILGSRRALERAVGTAGAPARYGALAHRLRAAGA